MRWCSDCAPQPPAESESPHAPKAIFTRTDSIGHVGQKRTPCVSYTCHKAHDVHNAPQTQLIRARSGHVPVTCFERKAFENALAISCYVLLGPALAVARFRRGICRDLGRRLRNSQRTCRCGNSKNHSKSDVGATRSRCENVRASVPVVASPAIIQVSHTHSQYGWRDTGGEHGKNRLVETLVQLARRLGRHHWSGGDRLRTVGRHTALRPLANISQLRGGWRRSLRRLSRLRRPARGVATNPHILAPAGRGVRLIPRRLNGI